MTAPLHLVMLPGMDGTGDLFAPLIGALPLSYSTQVVRYPGHEVLGYKELEQNIRSGLPTEPYVLLGESFSGPLALSIAASKPPGLRAIILCCTFARYPHTALAPFSKLLESRWLPQIAPRRFMPIAGPILLGISAQPQLTQMLKNSLSQVSASVMARRAREVLEVNVQPLLAHLRVPVLYLQALQDRVVPAQAVRLLQRDLPDMQVVRLAGPHCLLQVAPAASALAIQDFCRTLAPSSS